MQQTGPAKVSVPALSADMTASMRTCCSQPAEPDVLLISNQAGPGGVSALTPRA